MRLVRELAAQHVVELRAFPAYRLSLAGDQLVPINNKLLNH